jgi:di/tricarboxylate transporter
MEETPGATKPSRKWVSAVPRPVIWGFVGAVLVSAVMSLRGLGAGLALGAAAGCTGVLLGAITDVIDGRMRPRAVVAGLGLGGLSGLVFSGFLLFILMPMTDQSGGLEGCGMAQALLLFYGTPVLCLVGAALGLVIASVVSHMRRWRRGAAMAPV